VKLAFYHCTLPEGRLGKEGVSYVVHRLANALVGRGHELTLFSLTTPLAMLFTSLSASPSIG
jgi:hypothetical protein